MDMSKTQAFALEMTEERKERMNRVSGEIVDLLLARLQGPIEAMAVLSLIMQSMEKMYGGRLEGVVVQKAEVPS